MQDKKWWGEKTFEGRTVQILGPYIDINIQLSAKVCIGLVQDGKLCKIDFSPNCSYDTINSQAKKKKSCNISVRFRIQISTTALKLSWRFKWNTSVCDGKQSAVCCFIPHSPVKGGNICGHGTARAGVAVHRSAC